MNWLSEIWGKKIIFFHDFVKLIINRKNAQKNFDQIWLPVEYKSVKLELKYFFIPKPYMDQ